MAKKLGMTIEFNADTSGINKAMKSINSAVSKTNKSLRGLNSALKIDPTNTTLLSAKYEGLQKNIDQTKTKINSLKQAQKQLSSEMRNGGTEKQREDYAKLEAEIVKSENSLKKYKKEMGTGNAQFDAFHNKVGIASEKLKGLTTIMMQVSAALVAVATASVAAFKQVDEGADNVIKATGATGQVAANMRDSFKNVAGEVNGSFSEIGKTMGEVATRFGYTGKQLETTTKDFQKFATITGMDGASAVHEISTAMRLFNIDGKESEKVLGLFAKTSQDTGISVDSLVSTISSTGVQLQQMGLSLSDSLALISQFDAAGINASEMLTRLQKAGAYYSQQGKDMSTGLIDLVNRLKDSSTQAQATAEAYDIFGTRAGYKFIELAKQGKISFGDINTSLEDYAGIVDNTYNETQDGVDEMKNSWKDLQTSLGELGEEFAEAFGPIISTIADIVGGLAEKFNTLPDPLQKLIPIITGLTVVITTLIAIVTALTIAMNILSANPIVLAITGIIIAVMALIAVIVLLVKNWDKIKEAIVKGFNYVKDKITNAIQVIKNKITEWIEVIKQIPIKIKEILGSLANKALQWGIDMIQGFIDGIKKMIGKVVDVVKGVGEKIASFLHFSRPDEGPLREYEKWMPDFMKGLAKGINDNKYLVEDAISSVANMLATGGNVDMNANVVGTPNPQQEIKSTLNVEMNTLGGLLQALSSKLDNINYNFNIPLDINGKEVAKATATYTKAELDSISMFNRMQKGIK